MIISKNKSIIKSVKKMIYLYILLTSVLTAVAVLLLKTAAALLKTNKPIALIREGQINESALKKAKMNLDELMSAARVAGFFNLGDIDTAILEPCGKISFLPMPMKRALNPKDFNFAPIREGVCRVIISNGNIIKENLQRSGISERAIEELLEQRGSSLGDILLATANDAGRVDFFHKQSS